MDFTDLNFFFNHLASLETGIGISVNHLRTQGEGGLGDYAHHITAYMKVIGKS